MHWTAMKKLVKIIVKKCLPTSKNKYGKLQNLKLGESIQNLLFCECVIDMEGFLIQIINDVKIFLTIRSRFQTYLILHVLTQATLTTNTNINLSHYQKHRQIEINSENQHNKNKITRIRNQAQRLSDPTKNQLCLDSFNYRKALHDYFLDHLILMQQLPQFGIINQVQQYFYIYMNSTFNEEINLLCIGDILSGKSTFLQSYTQSTSDNLHYRIYPKINVDQTVVYFHQVKERFGMQAYFSYPFDAILYFLNIDDYHNPQFAIIQQLAQISKVNGTNIFKIPLKVIVLSSKNNQWTRIEKLRKFNLIRELEGMVTQSMIIFVQNNLAFLEELETFFKNVENQQAQGIQESLYVDWQLKGMQGLLPFENLILNLKKMSQQLKKQWSKLHFPNMLKKKLA